MGKLYVIVSRGVTMDYLLEEAEKAPDTVVIDSRLGPQPNFFKQATRFLFVGRCRLPLWLLRVWFPLPFLRQLREVTADDSVLVFESLTPRALGMLHYLLPRATRKYNWFYNPVAPLFPGKNPDKLFRKFERLGFQLVTFDPDDARRYGMAWHKQFLRYPRQSSVKPAIEYDFYFLGISKGREAYLLRLKAYLESHGFTCLFIVPHSQDEKITYEENIRHIDRCRCVVDLYQQNQTGLTRRPLEALFHNKKLLTNNPLIKHSDFYSPCNTHVLQGDSFEGISAFMKIPLEPVPDEIKRTYNMTEWLDYFRP